jgi:twitching motility protein PilT
MMYSVEYKTSKRFHKKRKDYQHFKGLAKFIPLKNRYLIMAVNPGTFQQLIKAGLQFDASDIHFREDEIPCFRIHGDLIPIKAAPMNKQDIICILKILLDNPEPKLEELNEYDGGKSFPGLCRLRFNTFIYQGKLAIVCRIIKTEVPSMEELGLTESLIDICRIKRGLVLITGPTGSGKSTTLAAMINYINNTRSGHIITIEDPVEYTIVPKKCRITQREVHVDTENFANGLRSALRQDPDVIMIGEMRDTETVDICLKAAETGHLVLSTIHTSNAENTIGRIIAMYPPETQKDARIRLGDNLFATVSQRLIKAADGKGALVAQEIMVSSPGIKSCINGTEDMKNFYTYITQGHGPGGNGSQTFNQHLHRLLRKKLITKEDAMEASSSSGDFAKSLDLET